MQHLKHWLWMFRAAIRHFSLKQRWFTRFLATWLRHRMTICAPHDCWLYAVLGGWLEGEKNVGGETVPSDVRQMEGETARGATDSLLRLDSRGNVEDAEVSGVAGEDSGIPPMVPGAVRSMPALSSRYQNPDGRVQ